MISGAVIASKMTSRLFSLKVCRVTTRTIHELPRTRCLFRVASWIVACLPFFQQPLELIAEGHLDCPGAILRRRPQNFSEVRRREIQSRKPKLHMIECVKEIRA